MDPYVIALCSMRVAIIGGGAAGFFSAISAKTNHSNAEVVLFEKTDKLLAKVRISGGGRCNVTHACHGARKLASNYPRGERFLRKAFEQFAVKDTVDWFAQRNVDLKTELDGRMFPTTDDSRSVITALMDEAEQLCDRSLPSVIIERLCGIVRSGHCHHGWKPQTRDVFVAQSLRPHDRSAGALAIHV